jgi:PEP-CTERM motif
MKGDGLMKRATLSLAALALLLGGVGQVKAGLIISEEGAVNLTGGPFDPGLNVFFGPMSTPVPGTITLVYGWVATVGSSSIDQYLLDSGFGSVPFNGVIFSTPPDEPAFTSVTLESTSGDFSQFTASDITFNAHAVALNYAGLPPSGEGGTGDVVFNYYTTATQPTPEPATLTMLGIGIASIAGYGWRRRKAPVA